MPEEKQPTLLEKLNAVIGKEGLKTELKITLTTETMFKMVIAITISILISYMMIELLKKIVKGAQ